MHSYQNIQNLHRYLICGGYANQNQRFSTQIVNQQHNLKILNFHVNEYPLNVNNASPNNKSKNVTFNFNQHFQWEINQIFLPEQCHASKII